MSKLSFGKFGSWLRRYFPISTIIVLGVVIYLSLFGETSVVQAAQNQRIIDSLQREIDLNRDSMMYFRELNHRLSSDPEMLERVVRENYNMKRPNEDVYVIE